MRPCPLYPLLWDWPHRSTKHWPTKDTRRMQKCKGKTLFVQASLQAKHGHNMVKWPRQTENGMSCFLLSGGTRSLLDDACIAGLWNAGKKGKCEPWVRLGWNIICCQGNTGYWFQDLWEPSLSSPAVSYGPQLCWDDLLDTCTANAQNTWVPMCQHHSLLTSRSMQTTWLPNRKCFHPVNSPAK
jgi:hypothetical protein